jgi:glucose-6-phosphate 1-dehydrogenase
MIRRIAILGAAGDLTFRYLLPALASLCAAGRLPPDFRILALVREKGETDAYRRLAAERLARHAETVDPAVRHALVEMIDYRSADASDRRSMAAALAPVDGPLIAYLALPPAVFAPAIEAIGHARIPSGSRIVVEKPFGEDLASAQKLNGLLHRTFPEDAIVRVDHFLALPAVQSIVGLRFANRLFEPLWNGEHIARVEIVWDETLALEGRASYYDHAGALRDMLQNHLLQLLALVAMEPPAHADERSLRDGKLAALQAVRQLSVDEVRRYSIHARYTAGRIGDRAIPAYVEEKGVDRSREAETFAQVRLAIDNERWRGVPFVLRSGKALRRDRYEIAVHFRPALLGPFSGLRANVLRLTLDPAHIHLGIDTSGDQDFFTLRRLALESGPAPDTLPAYARLLLGVMAGDSSLSVRDDEAEESWRIVEPILAAWRCGTPPLQEYPAGSDGPASADDTPDRQPEKARQQDTMLKKMDARCSGATPLIPIGIAAALGAVFIAAKRMRPARAQNDGKFPPMGKIVRHDPRLGELIAPDAKLELLASGFEWLEGPVWIKSEGSLLFSDIPHNSVMKWKEGAGTSLFMKPAGYTGVAEYGREPGSNGLAVDPQGRLVVCEHGDRRISRLEVSGGKYTLVDSYLGKRLNSPNDLVFKSNGDLYFTDPPYGLPQGVDDPRRELEFCGVYRFSTNGQLTLLTGEMSFPNGIALSPDERTLYVAQSDPRRAVWMSFPVRDDGTLGAGRVFHDATSLAGELPGLPDGMKVDRAGNLFATGPGGVHIFAPDGTALGRIDTGGKTANCAWGDDGSVLYIAAGKHLCRIKTSTKGAGW